MKKMSNRECFNDVMSYALSLAKVGIENPQTGFLWGEVYNSFSEEQATELLVVADQTVKDFSEIIIDCCNGNDLTDYELRSLYMYIFDKTTEVAIKSIRGQDYDDVKLSLKEAFEYHYPDLPEYLQLKLTKVVPCVTCIGIEVQSYIDKKGYHKDDKINWLRLLLSTSSSLAIIFSKEIDFNDDSELRHYLFDE